MATNAPRAPQLVSEAAVWAHLSADLQVQAVRLLAQLAAHLVLAQAEPIQQERKEACDAFSCTQQQNPA
ncbi:MAG TPA: hypothetical protein VN207_12330 [Ktedonobacteraceae bacterium]|nr:hypothetical protein [Ktedonobacteraceae bacterium]